MCCCQNTAVQTVTVQFVMYVQCAQYYCNTQCVAVRTHRYRTSQYNLLCTFSVHNITVTRNVLLSEHTGTDLHSTIGYVRSVCTALMPPFSMVKNPNIIIGFMSGRPSFNAGYMIWYDVFLKYNWVHSRWQQYSTHLHTNSKQINTMKQNTQNGTDITIRIHNIIITIHNLQNYT